MDYRRVFVLAVLLLLPSAVAFGVEPAKFMRTYLGREGYVALRAIQGAGMYNAVVMNKEQVQKLLDARQMKLDELKEKYPDIKQEADERLATAEKRAKEEAAKYSGYDVFAQVHVDGQLELGLYRVVHVGDDHVLLESQHPEKTNVVIALSSIPRISWYSGGPRVTSSTRMEKKKQPAKE